jgi:drug/metabolite transporter (DMT)-like permease
MGGEKIKKFGWPEAMIFIFALIGGTLCSLSSKIMLTMKGIGMTGEEENFSFPLFQTFGMFLGMTAALAGHYFVVKFKIPFPGYPGYDPEVLPADAVVEPIPMWKIAMLVIPSVFDLIASALAMFGLRYVNVSIYQMLRGSAIIFVALLKQFFLGHHLQRYKWVGIAFNVLSIVLVGFTAMMSSGESANEDSQFNSPLTGVILILCGAFVQSLQYAFEEKMMTDDDTAIPPLLLIGMEGFWGTLLCVFLLYPAAYAIKGPDHGCFENPFNTWYMIKNSPHIQSVFLLYFFSVLQYNILAVLVTYMLDSVWHAILDNFRPVTVWGMDLYIFYFISQAFGEQWTNWSFLQLFGMFVLLYGTAIYNAPNAGSIYLRGDAISLFIDCSDDYNNLNDDHEPLSTQCDSHHSEPVKPANPLIPHHAPPTPKRTTEVAYREGISPMILMSPAVGNRDKERREIARSMERDHQGIALLGKIQPRSKYGGLDA